MTPIGTTDMTKRFERKVVVKNKQGLHARPAALFVQIANKYDATVKVQKDDQIVNGKSIMGILMLAAEKDSEIILIAEGSDGEEALNELEKLVNSDE
jgi:phosphotransferase system HPr (HPr) family protein